MEPFDPERLDKSSQPAAAEAFNASPAADSAQTSVQSPNPRLDSLVLNNKPFLLLAFFCLVQQTQ